MTYATALKPSSPRASKKNFDGVGETYKAAEIYNNKPGIFYSEEEIQVLAEPYKFSLIGKFLGPRPNPVVVLQAFRNLGLSSFYNVRFLRAGYIFIHLAVNEDMTRVWTCGIWIIGGVPLRIFKWSPHFSYEVESSVVPVWVRLPDLPIHMYYKSCLFSAASIIRKPIKIDEATVNGSRLSVARVCVEVDVLKPKVEDFWIGIGEEKRLQKVIYEKLPKYCGHCLHLRHSVDECYVLGNKLKLMLKDPNREVAAVEEDLRGFLNRRREGDKGKEVMTDYQEAHDEGVEKTTKEKRAWVRKKGFSRTGLEGGAVFKNVFDPLADLEMGEERDDAGEHGVQLDGEPSVRAAGSQQRKDPPNSALMDFDNLEREGLVQAVEEEGNDGNKGLVDGTSLPGRIAELTEEAAARREVDEGRTNLELGLGRDTGNTRAGRWAGAPSSMFPSRDPRQQPLEKETNPGPGLMISVGRMSVILQRGLPESVVMGQKLRGKEPRFLTNPLHLDSHRGTQLTNYSIELVPEFDPGHGKYCQLNRAEEEKEKGDDDESSNMHAIMEGDSRNKVFVEMVHSDTNESVTGQRNSGQTISSSLPHGRDDAWIPLEKVTVVGTQRITRSKSQALRDSSSSHV